MILLNCCLEGDKVFIKFLRWLYASFEKSMQYNLVNLFEKIKLTRKSFDTLAVDKERESGILCWYTMYPATSSKFYCLSRRRSTCWSNSFRISSVNQVSLLGIRLTCRFNSFRISFFRDLSEHRPFEQLLSLVGVRALDVRLQVSLLRKCVSAKWTHEGTLSSMSEKQQKFIFKRSYWNLSHEA